MFTNKNIKFGEISNLCLLGLQVMPIAQMLTNKKIEISNPCLLGLHQCKTQVNKTASNKLFFYKSLSSLFSLRPKSILLKIDPALPKFFKINTLNIV